MTQIEQEQLLFVYGSLKRGFSNHRLLSGASFVGDCRTARRYRLLVLGTYPALATEGDQQIQGELYLVNARTLSHLDAFEGEAYFRGSVELADTRTAQAYFLVPDLLQRASPVFEDRWL